MLKTIRSTKLCGLVGDLNCTIEIEMTYDTKQRVYYVATRNSLDKNADPEPLWFPSMEAADDCYDEMLENAEATFSDIDEDYDIEDDAEDDDEEEEEDLWK